MLRVNLSGWLRLALCALAFVTACTQAPSPTATLAPTATATPNTAATAAAATEAAVQVAEQQAAQVATGIAATLTAQPTATETATTEPSDTPTATNTPTKAPTNTPAATATRTRTPGPTPTELGQAAPPVTATNTAAPVSASIYGFTDGAPGYITDINCTFAGGDCVSAMPQGDVSFEFVLISDVSTPLTLFEQYGLAVERDGVNIPDMFMFVDAGLLPPDTGVWFGASRNFTIPGRYVVKSSGCLTTVPAPCGWNTMAGTTVTFVIK